MSEICNNDLRDDQLFSEAEAEIPAAEAAAPEQIAGEQEEAAPDAGEPAEAFETLIRGKYKKEFDSRVQKILDGRLRKARSEQEEYRRERQRREETARQALDRLELDAPQVQQRYPQFNWQQELQNADFGRLIAAGCDAMSAYEMAHREELLRDAMAFTARTTREKISRSLASGRRIAENGSLAHSTAIVRTDPGKLTSQELSDIRKRVLGGEKIKF
jgi:hypothetical protein